MMAKSADILPFLGAVTKRIRRTQAASPNVVLLHVGHGKTGSSYLQSALTNSSDSLGAHDIAYPIVRGNVAHTRAGGISSGNLVPTPKALLRLLDSGWTGPQDRLLLSSEGFFYQMQRTGFLDTLRERLPDAELRILLYIRDPLDHAVSTYHQGIKRGRSTGDFDATLKSYNGPGLVANFLNFVDGYGADVTILNYSRHRDALMDTFEEWLGVPQGTLTRPPVSVVNRSLTNGETEFLRQFNAAFGEKGAQFLADPLCEQLPHIRAERPPASAEALNGFLRRMRQMIDRSGLDSRIPEDERYRLETPEQAAARFVDPEDDPVFSLRRSQIELIAKLIIARMNRDSGS